MNPVLQLLVILLLLPVPAAAQEIGTVTLVEGALRVIRGAAVLQGVEGMRLHQGDMLESSDPGFAQLEFAKGTIVALGASTRLFLFSAGAGRTGDNVKEKANAAELVMLSGWLKGETRSSAAAYRYDSPLLAATTLDGTIILHAAPGAAEAFVESGSAGVGEVTPEGILVHPATAKAGQFFSRRAGRSIITNSRADASFIQSMPRPFRDTFPPRLSRFTGKPAEPRPEHEVSYAEIQPWLTMGRSWRRGFVERFHPLLKDAAFRKALENHLGDHPEWDPMLHPEKFQPKTTPPPTDKPDSLHGRY
jgi:hypothetical protein